MYFVCRLELCSEDETLAKQESEIAECRWIPKAEWDDYCKNVPSFLKPMFGQRSEEMGEAASEMIADKMEMQNNVWETFFPRYPASASKRKTRQKKKLIQDCHTGLDSDCRAEDEKWM